jgi:uncharacterized membrane protein YhaH (DUF805 family)
MTEKTAKSMPSLIVLLFSFHGRIPRSRYWFGVLLLLALTVIMLMAFAPYLSTTGGTGADRAFFFTMMILTIWVFAAVSAKRLHDIGWSGWWTILLSVIPVLLWYASHETYHHIEQSYAAQQAVQPLIIAMEFGAYLFFFIGLLILGIKAGSPVSNTRSADPLQPASGAPTA